MAVHEHKKDQTLQVRCKIITVSDTRTKEEDKSGQLMIKYLEGQGHKIVDYCIVKDEEDSIKNEVLKGAEDEEVDAILLNGGTGIAKRDVTIETVEKLFDKHITGFGELFRMLSYQEDIGSAAILSRATAGVIQNKALFATPGSSGAVKLAMEKLIIPELRHIIKELQKDL